MAILLFCLPDYDYTTMKTISRIFKVGKKTIL